MDRRNNEQPADCDYHQLRPDHPWAKTVYILSLPLRPVTQTAQSMTPPIASSLQLLVLHAPLSRYTRAPARCLLTHRGLSCPTAPNMASEWAIPPALKWLAVMWSISSSLPGHWRRVITSATILAATAEERCGILWGREIGRLHVQCCVEGSPMATHPISAKIIADPNILAGKPIIAGTRISVQLVLEKLRDGWTIEDLLDDYPHLTREQIIAALAYAADAMSAPATP